MTDHEIKCQLKEARLSLQSLDDKVDNNDIKNALYYVKNCITEIENREKDNIELTVGDINDTSFREGDILAIENKDGEKTIIIFKSNDKNWFIYYACLSEYEGKNNLYFNNSVDVSYRPVRKATGEESELLYQALDEKKLLVNVEEHKLEYDFKPFDRVLVRNNEREFWNVALFSHTLGHSTNKEYVTSNGIYWQHCIPYKGNEELVGTTDESNIKL